MEGSPTSIRSEGNKGLDAMVTFLANSGADLRTLEPEINIIRQAVRYPESSDRSEANRSLDNLVQTLYNKGANLVSMQPSIDAVRQAIKG